MISENYNINETATEKSQKCPPIMLYVIKDVNKLIELGTRKDFQQNWL